MAGIDVREHGTGVIVALQVRPRSRPGLEVTEAGLVIRVSAPPEKGKATDEARRALADALDVPQSSVALRSGPTSRRKSFTAEGIDVVNARQRLLKASA